MKLKPLNLETDVDLLMEFRQTYKDMWVKFCADKGYEAEVFE
jgi:hypothetical protein